MAESKYYWSGCKTPSHISMPHQNLDLFDQNLYQVCFSLPNNPQNPDLSCKADLDFSGSILMEKKSYYQRNIVLGTTCNI